MLRSKPPAELTTREHEVAELASLGCSNREIGEHLGVTIGTVKRHLSTIFSKWDVRNRTELTHRAMSEGWLRLPS